MVDMKSLGENIRKERKRQLMTIEVLAEKAGITDNFLGKIERGESKPSFQTVDSIASALGVTIDFLKETKKHMAGLKILTDIKEFNSLSDENKEKFIDFLNTNIKYFK